MGRKLLKTVQTITTFRNPLADPVGTRRGPPLVRGPQFENRCSKQYRITVDSTIQNTIRYDTRRYFNVRSKADISQLNLPHGTDN